MTPENPSRRPTLEDVIRIKRAERPPGEFWDRFEHELRARQLAAIVERRPWWQPLAARVSGRKAMVAGLGAAAVAVGLAYLPESTSQTAPGSPIVAAAGSASNRSLVSAVAFSTAPARPAAEIAMNLSEPTAPSVGAFAAGVTGGSRDDNRAPITAPGLVDSAMVAVSFSEVRVPPPRSAMEAVLPAPMLVFEPVTKVDSGVHEPLATIPTPREQRAARFASSVTEIAMVAAPVVAPLRSRATPRDADLRDREFGRLSAQGNALAVKFW